MQSLKYNRDTTAAVPSESTFDVAQSVSTIACKHYAQEHRYNICPALWQRCVCQVVQTDDSVDENTKAISFVSNCLTIGTVKHSAV